MAIFWSILEKSVSLKEICPEKYVSLIKIFFENLLNKKIGHQQFVSLIQISHLSGVAPQTAGCSYPDSTVFIICGRPLTSVKGMEKNGPCVTELSLIHI